MDDQKLSSGVQQLIDRLREEGISEGRNQADKLLEDARNQARQIINRARDEAEGILVQAREEAEQYRNNAREAMEIAARDTVLELKSNLTSRFNRRVSEMVGITINDQEFLQKVILEIAGRVREQIEEGERVEILLPADIIGLEELRRHPEKVKEGSLGQFVLSGAGQMFREGVTIRGGTHKKGIQIRLVDQKLQIDISEQVIAEILMQHLVPRFRALLEGSIQ